MFMNGRLLIDGKLAKWQNLQRLNININFVLLTVCCNCLAFKESFQLLGFFQDSHQQ
jgi:hypothetical protein